jgi:hypothetical protein
MEWHELFFKARARTIHSDINDTSVFEHNQSHVIRQHVRGDTWPTQRATQSVGP